MQPHRKRIKIPLTLSMILAVAWPLYAQPGTSADSGSAYTLSTGKISVRVASAGGHLGAMTVRNAGPSRTITLPEAFTLQMQDRTIIPASRLAIERPLSRESFSGGKRICADLQSANLRIGMRWCLLARENAGYLRQQLTIHAAASDLPIAEVRLLDFSDPDAHLAGSVRGSPIVDGTMFFAFEHPLSWAKVDAGHATAAISRQLPLRAGQSVTYSAVIGVATPAQMRRDFLTYIEAERPRPYQPFLHYNSWFDLGFGNRYDEAGALNRVHAFGAELVAKRHVRLDSFLFDDGWDDPHSLWGFDSGFPHGFTPVAEAAKQIHAGIGVWLSPWGGYD